MSNRSLAAPDGPASIPKACARSASGPGGAVFFFVIVGVGRDLQMIKSLGFGKKRFVAARTL